MFYCSEVQNALLYLGLECCIVQGFRMLYCSGGSEYVFCSEVQNVLLYLGLECCIVQGG